MKTLASICAWGLLLGAGLTADPLYQINFTGTLTSGRETGFNLDTNTNQQAQDLTGLQVSGSLLFNLGAASPATVATDASGFINTTVQATSGLAFISESLIINGFTPPTNFLPFPTVFNQAPIPTVPAGATLSVSQNLQLGCLGSMDRKIGLRNKCFPCQYLIGRTLARFSGANSVRSRF